jgi:ATP-dependent Clp protease ATP-binding subunit ClpC
MKDKVMEELKRVFRPEFMNRIDGQVVFHALSKEHIRAVVDLNLADVGKNLMLKGLSMEVTDAARDWLGEKGYDPVFGARPLRRVIQNEIEDRLSEAVLEQRFSPGETILIDVQNDEVVLTKQETPALASSSG